MLGIIWKHDYLSFHWYFIYYCFAGTCAGWLNWVQCQKINLAKLDNFNRWYQFGDVIHHVRNHVKAYLIFSFQLVHYFLWLPGRNVRKVIILDAMSKTQCYKIAPIFHIQHDVLFWRILVQWMGSGYACIRSQKESIKHDMACISHTIR